LCFHASSIQVFFNKSTLFNCQVNIVNSQVEPPVTPYTDAGFRDIGIEPFSGGPERASSLGDLRLLSENIENWHNGAHARIQVATGVPMMNAAENIFYRVFWQLHFYIDDRFKEGLQQYEAEVHPDAFLNVSAIAAHIEVSHHSWVQEI
jgi:hypothetical protein